MKKASKMCKELDEEIERGNKATMELLRHVDSMGASGIKETIEYNGHVWEIVVKIKACKHGED